ncbi:MAG: GIY-YIG nuclease family protein [Paraclostridium sp.]
MHVYKITNKINGKIYIGKTIKDNLEIRLKEHSRFKSLKNKKMMICEAIKKHGLENFVIESLYKGENNEDICEKEVFLIKENRSTEPEVGYNILPGGKGVRHTQKMKKALSERAKLRVGVLNPFYGKTHSLTQKQKWSKERKGLYSRKSEHTEEEKSKTSERMRKLWRNAEFVEMMKNLNKKQKVGENASRNRAVVCLELNSEYASSKLCADALNVAFNTTVFDRRGIGAVCRGEKHSHNNMTFAFKDKKVKKNKVKENSKVKKKVTVLELNKTFNSKKECSDYLKEKTNEKYFEKYMKNNSVYKGYTFICH